MADRKAESEAPGTPGVPGAPGVGAGEGVFHPNKNVETAIRALDIKPVKGGLLTSIQTLDGLHFQSALNIGAKCGQNPLNRERIKAVVVHAFQHGVGLDKEAAIDSAEMILSKSRRDPRNSLLNALVDPEVKEALIPEEKKLNTGDEFKNPLGALYYNLDLACILHNKLLEDPVIGEDLLKIAEASIKRQSEA